MPSPYCKVLIDTFVYSEHVRPTHCRAAVPA